MSSTYSSSEVLSAPVVCGSSNQQHDHVSSSTAVPMGTLSSYTHSYGNDYSENKFSRGHETPFCSTSASLSSKRLRSCDVYIGFHGWKPFLLRFVDWLRAELEVQGVSCFVSDRARCRNSQKRGIAKRAMNVSTLGVVILTKKSFRNPYSIEELQFFAGRKNLVPIFFDLGPGDCVARDIVEKRGQLWEKHGGKLWMLYGGSEKEWREAVNGLSRVDDWKLEAQDGKWRDCILRAVVLLATRLGRRSVVERLTMWREKVEKEEFPFPRNEKFIGRKNELSELELILFGNVGGDSDKDYFELKARPRRKGLTIAWSKNGAAEERRKKRQMESRNLKGKELVEWKESEMDIEMQGVEFSQRQHQPRRPKNGESYGSRGRRRSVKILCGKGIACLSGDSGIGKTELLLEFAHRFHQRYKMVLWIGGESRYIRQNYLNLWSFLEVDVGIENCPEISRMRSFEEQEEAAISRVRKELMRNIPFLVVIDNLESEKDWWDHKLVMNLLPRFGNETHILISTCLPRIMNLEPLKLSYLSEAEAMSLMHGSLKDYSNAEIDALKVIDEKLGRLTLGLAIVGAILSELPLNPTALLDIISRTPLRNLSWSDKEDQVLQQNIFLLQLFEVCFSIFDLADGPRSLASKMVQVSGWFAPAAIPISLLSLAAHKIPENRQGSRLLKKILRALSCGITPSYSKKSAAEASSLLVRFNFARSSTRTGNLHFNELIKLYASKKGATGEARAMVLAVMSHWSISQNSEHLWAACFLLFGFRNDSRVVKLKVLELLFLVKEAVIPFAIQTFTAFSRCSAALELLRNCTDALEAADEALVTPTEKSLCWKPIQTQAQLNPYLWQELALSRAMTLETRAKLMLRGGQFDIGDDLIRKALFIRTSICGEDHPDTVSARSTLCKLTELLADAEMHTSPKQVYF